MGGQLANVTSESLLASFSPTDGSRDCLGWVASHPMPQGATFEHSIGGLPGGNNFVVAVASVNLQGEVSPLSTAVAVRTLVPTSPAKPPFPPALAAGATAPSQGRRMGEMASDRLVFDGAAPAEPMAVPGLARVVGGGHVWLAVADATGGGLPVTH